MKSTQSSQKIRTQLADLTHTNPEDWHLCLKARFGMAIIFQAIAKTEGKGEVITTPYTCATAINPILVSHLTPTYADLDLPTLSIKNPEKLIKKTTKAIVMQHTLGIIGNKQNLRALADKHRLILIEDSAHCLARLALDSRSQPLADISIHSFGVEKILPTKFGAAIYLNPTLAKTHPKLHEKITADLNNLKTPNPATALRLRAYRLTNALLQRLPRPLKKNFRTLAIKTKILEPPIAPEEQKGKQAKPLATNDFINQKILAALPSLPKNYKRRLDITQHYAQVLSNTKYLALPTTVNEPLLAFPILLPTPERRPPQAVQTKSAKADQLYDALTASGHFIRRWYSPLFFPGIKSPRTYHYDPKTCPKAESTHPRILCLPTDIPKSQANQILSIINPKTTQ